jgi:hypothetical protein
MIGRVRDSVIESGIPFARLSVIARFGYNSPWVRIVELELFLLCLVYMNREFSKGKMEPRKVPFPSSYLL